MTQLDKAQIAKLKRQGFINQNDKEHFAVRIKIQAGNINAEQMNKLSEIANKYGKGYVGLTTRLDIEIPWVKYEDLENVKQLLSGAGLAPGGTGPTVRPIVACKGTICTFGLIDTQGLCKRLDEKFFGMEVAAKCKIGITGCPNNCAKAQLNDIGFMGQCVPKVNESDCKVCGACISVCKVKAIEKADYKVKIDFSKCVNCGQCIKACTSSAISADRQGYVMYLGGKFGRKYRIGERVDTVMTMEEAVEFTGRVLDYYKQNANAGERLADMVNRIGIDNLLGGIQ